MLHPDSILGTGGDASGEPLLAVDEIQGNVLPGFGAKFMTFVGLKIVPGGEDAARRWLRELAPCVTTLRQMTGVREVRRAVARATGVRPQMPDLLLNVVLAHSALAALGLDAGGVEPIFTRGMREANFHDPEDVEWQLGDTPEKSPDVLLIVGSDVETIVTDFVALLPGRLAGLRAVYVEPGALLGGDIEHFGFRDGISQPGVRGRLSERPDHVLTRRYFDSGDPRATTYARPGQPLVWPGQFLFGYPVQVEDDPEMPGLVAEPPAPWMRNGSYMVYRRLNQNVTAFRRFAGEHAPAISQKLGRAVSAEELQALIVGRWPDGTPLVRSPERPDPAMADDDDAINFFSYADEERDAQIVVDGTSVTIPGAPGDDAASRCPHFAHIRKVNLRDKGTDKGSPLLFRLLRRGIPFGPPFTEGEADGIDRGLLFVSYQRNLELQFMTHVETWMNAPDAPEGFGHDLLVGQSATPRFGDLHNGERLLDAPAATTWIVPTGGGFFFSPAVSVLREL
jgi:Dyp-type peroxidase family